MTEPPAGRPRLTHVDDAGAARMVDVGGKPATLRIARAEARVQMAPDVLEQLLSGRLPKGEALAVARIAGIQAAKDTARLIPLCHGLPLSHVAVQFAPLGADALGITAEARTLAATGVEMEAMTAVAVAALTVYDMVKGVCRTACIEHVRLLHKSGGRSGVWDRPSPPGP